MKIFALFPLCAVVVLTGCYSPRSISDSGYESDASIRYRQRTNVFKGELSELGVLGIERNPKITEQDIAAALDSASRVKIRKGGNSSLSSPEQPTPMSR